jgi:hypothetical protein
MEVNSQREAPAIYPQGKNPSTHWRGPRASVDILEKRKKIHGQMSPTSGFSGIENDKWVPTFWQNMLPPS